MITLIVVLFAAGLYFVALPGAILGRPASARNGLDAVVINAIRWTALTVGLTHILVPLRLFETVTLAILAAIGTYFFRLRPRGITPARLQQRLFPIVVRMLNAADRADQRRVGGGETLHVPDGDDTPHPGSRFRRRQRNGGRALTLVGLSSPQIGVLLASFWLRVVPALSTPALSPSDAYVHLQWARDIAMNRIYTDGIYPHGMPILLAWLAKASPMVDPVDVVRFFGPIVGTLMVFAGGYLTLRLTRSPAAALLAMGAFGLTGMRPEWHSSWLRQTGTLPQELGVAITLLTLTFFVLAVVERDRDHYWTIGAAALLLGFLHPIPLALMLVLGSVGAGTAALLVPGGIRRAFESVGVALAAAAAGLLVMPAASLLGVRVYGGATNLNPVSGRGGGTADFFVNPAFLTMAVMAIALAIAGGVIALRTHRRQLGARLLALTTMAAVVVAVYDPTVVPLDPFYTRRLADVTGPMMMLALGAGLGALGIVPWLRPTSLARAGILSGVGLAVLSLFVQRFPAEGSEQLDYIEPRVAARELERIKDTEDPKRYTVIGTSEQLRRMGDHGWFVHLWVFLRDAGFTDDDDGGPSRHPAPSARDPLTPIAIATPTIYLFVETEPYREYRELPARDADSEYYRNHGRRAQVMAAALRWAEEFRRYHANIDVVFDDDGLRIYRIRQRISPAAADESPLFKDYGWRPGQLFQTDPASIDEAVGE